MKIKDAIAVLQKMNPEEEVIIDWWDRRCFTRVIGDTRADDEIPFEHCWIEVVHEWEDMQTQNNLTDEIWDWIHEGLVEKGAYND
jgi:hypothetical protein